MRRILLLSSLLMGAVLAGCDRSDAEPLAPTAVTRDTTTHVPTVDATPKDTVVAVLPRRFPPVDSLVFSFVSVSPAGGLRVFRAVSKDSVVRLPLDTGTSRVWRLSVQGRKAGRPWWGLDSIRVEPDSSRRIVLDSAWRRLVVADTSAPVVVVPVDTSLYVPIASLAGDTVLFTDGDRGLFLRYRAGVLSLTLVSDGNYPGPSYDRVTNAQFVMGFSRSGTVDSVGWAEPLYNGKRDNDSLSRVWWSRDSSHAVRGVVGNLFARFLPKVLAVPVSRCTVDVAVAFRSGIQNSAGWAPAQVPADTALRLLSLGSNRIRPSKTHFKIVIP